jgi:hypothetical protein
MIVVLHVPNIIRLEIKNLDFFDKQDYYATGGDLLAIWRIIL